MNVFVKTIAGDGNLAPNVIVCCEPWSRRKPSMLSTSIIIHPGEAAGRSQGGPPPHQTRVAGWVVSSTRGWPCPRPWPWHNGARTTHRPRRIWARGNYHAYMGECGLLAGGLRVCCGAPAAPPADGRKRTCTRAATMSRHSSWNPKVLLPGTPGACEQAPGARGDAVLVGGQIHPWVVIV